MSTGFGDVEDDSDCEYSFEGVNVRPHKVDRYGRFLPTKARTQALEDPILGTSEISEEPSSTKDGAHTSNASASPGGGKAVGASAAPLTPVQVRVTPYHPKNNPQQTRRRSWEALESARRQLESATGQQPRLIVEPQTGFLLPRDQVVGAETVDTNEREHYQRSLAILEEVREERMMRFFLGS